MKTNPTKQVTSIVYLNMHVHVAALFKSTMDSRFEIALRFAVLSTISLL